MSTILHDVALALGYGLIGLAAGTLLVTILLGVYAGGWLLLHRGQTETSSHAEDGVLSFPRRPYDQGRW